LDFSGLAGALRLIAAVISITARDPHIVQTPYATRIPPSVRTERISMGARHAHGTWARGLKGARTFMGMDRLEVDWRFQRDGGGGDVGVVGLALPLSSWGFDLGFHRGLDVGCAS
jgi:hypothetical protein